jgi:hypothetical protein
MDFARGLQRTATERFLPMHVEQVLHARKIKLKHFQTNKNGKNSFATHQEVHFQLAM